MATSTVRTGNPLAIFAGAAVISATLIGINFASTTTAEQRSPASVRPTDSPTWAPGGSRERFTPENAVFAFVDHQTGLMNLVENVKAVEFKNYVLGLAELAKVHEMPSVITTSAEDGPNGPKLPEVLALLPDAPVIARPGQINAWDNSDFVRAIEETGRRKIIMSGITTDVCVAFATLAAIDAGYEVYVVVDASGTMNQEVQNAAIIRMANAGAVIGNWFAIACELLDDWRKPAGPASAELFKKYLPSYAEVAASHAARSGE